MPDETIEFLKQSIASHDRQIGELTDRLAEVKDHLAEVSGQIAAQAVNINKLTANVDNLTTSMHKLVDVTNQDATAIRQLAVIAQRPERRLDNLDGGQ